MNCKNCGNTLSENAEFCDNCGAKVISNRITFKRLLIDFFINSFGVDSRFFLTVRKMITHPDQVVLEYLHGVRKKYVNPFAFLALGAGLSLIIFNYFADDFMAVQATVNAEQIKDLKQKAERDITKEKNLTEKEIQQIKIEKKVAQMNLKFLDSMWDFMLGYFNLLTFVFLILYAILSKWTFWKPHNFGEHVIINGYIYGFTTYFTLIAFFIAMLTHPNVYMLSIFGAIIYYMYAFGKIYKLSLGRNILKLLKFILGLLIVFIITLIIIGIIMYLITYLGIIEIE